MRLSIPGLVTLFLCACGGASPAPAPPARAPAVAAAGGVAASAQPAASAAASAQLTLRRSSVHEVLVQGLGAFLQRVELDDRPVVVGGRFHGFRVTKLRDAAFWNGVDVKPGDVVTSVNGFPIERPEQAQTAFDSLDVASELRVAYDRDGQPRELVYAIVDDK